MTQDEAWHVLYVEDDAVLGQQVREILEMGDCGPLTVQLIGSFDEALSVIEERRFDLIILDVFAGRPSLERERAGLGVLEFLKRVRFIPTIFYTALPAAIDGEKSPFVKIVSKEGTGFDPLLNAIQSFIDSGLLQLNKGLVRHLEIAQLNYMQNFVALHWDTFSSLPDRRALAYLLTRRLAASLTAGDVNGFAEALGAMPLTDTDTDSANISEAADVVHRMHYYIMPPVSTDILAGDIVQHMEGDKSIYRVVLTPSCDMVTGRGATKAQHVVLACCERLEEFQEYQEWIEDPSSSKRKEALKSILKNNRKVKNTQPDRYHYLPGVFYLPHLVVDFQQIDRISFVELQSLSRIASLDSPYAEALLSRYNRYINRLGTPDLDLEDIINSLTPTKDSKDSQAS